MMLLSPAPVSTLCRFRPQRSQANCRVESSRLRGRGLSLHNGVLTATESGALRLPHAELTDLSARSTADQGPATKEAIGLASAFHLAGLPS